ncbi:hypothetical protein Tco_1452745, partial [Tanacetum coccineum]
LPFTSPNKGIRTSQPLPEGTITAPKDSVGNKQPIDTGLTSTASDEGTAKTTPRPEGPLGDKDLRGSKPPADMEPIHPTVVDPSGTGAKYQMNQTQSTRLRYQSLIENKGKPSHEEELDTQPLVLSTYEDVRAFLLSNDEAQESKEAEKPQSSHAPSTEASDTDSSCDDILRKYDNTFPPTERQLVAVNYANLKASIDEYYDENIAQRDQTDKLVEASMSSLDKSSTTISDLYKGLNIITELLKEINNALKDDHAHALKKHKELANWAKSSTNMAWKLGSRLLGQSSGSVTPTLALTHIPANVEGENATNTATEDPLSHTEGNTDANRQENLDESKHSRDANIEFIGKGIAIDEQVEDQKKLVKALSIIRPGPDALILYTINGETEVNKVVREEAKKLEIHPKEAITTKAGEKFKKAQDAEHEVLKRKHTKVRKSLVFRKHKYDNYMWTISNRLKPKTIIDIKIHSKTKPVIITVFRGIDGRNFDVHNPFAFGDFGISELDELREIIPTKKNAVVIDFMNSLGQRHERI